MNFSPAPVEPPLRVSPAAIARIRELMREEGGAARRLRVFVEGGGCSGFQYGFRFEDARAADDLVLECGGVELLLDALSRPYLAGAELDYVDELAGAKFVVRNPNAHATCGCGSSFSA